MKVLKTKKVVLAMSGGVDSSVTAWLLKKQGYHVEGVFMKNWEEHDTINHCNSLQDLKDVESVCEKLKIVLHKINFSSEYWNKVFIKMLNSLNQGHTPNPDILCNKEIKFNTFVKFAKDYLEADFISTGHYVRKKKIHGTNILLKGKDLNKDQSYFLYTLDSRIISFLLFPVGILNKNKVRKIANDIPLINANKKDSTGICFIGKMKFKNFLLKFLPKKIGNILNTEGEIIGKHDGFMYYTIGQRQGLGIGGIKNNKNNNPWYVAKKDINLNHIIVVQNKNHPLLMSIGIIIKNIHWINKNILKLQNKYLKCFVKTRYRQKEHPCLIFLKNKKLVEVSFNYPIKSVSSGQSAVFYLKEVCLGGGIIDKVLTLDQNK